MKGAAATGHNGTLGLIRNTQRVSGKQVAFRYLLVGLFSSAAWVGSSCAKNAAVLPSLPTRDTVMAPPDLANTNWLEGLRAAQLKTRDRFAVFHDFRFTDRLPRAASPSSTASWTTPGRPTRRLHYDHGNGLAIADVDGDGLPRHLFRQPGRRQPALEESRRRPVREHHGRGRRGACRQGRRRRPRSPTSTTTATPDLYVTTVRGGNVLFENDGKGRFKDISAASGLDLRRPLVRRRVLRLRPRRPARSVPRQRRPIHDRHDRAATATSTTSAFEDAFAGHLKPERAEPSILYRNEGGNRFVDVSQRIGLQDTLVVRRRQRRRRQRRRLARSLRPEHAGRRRVLRERRRQALRQEEPRRCSRGRRGARWASRCSTSTTTGAWTSSSPTCTPT